MKNMSNRRNKPLDGQLTIFDFCLDASNYVVQSNDIITGKQSLSINAAKLLRSAIMQVKPGDEELKPYILSISELAQLLNLPRQDIHRDIEKITAEITSNPLCIRAEKKGKIRWARFVWVKTCEYDSDEGIYITLNDDLKPLLLNLKRNYTQYTLDSVLTMKSIYAIRLFELLLSKVMTQLINKQGENIELTIDEIRTACDCQDKYKSFTSFREKVIEKGISEINGKTMYKVSYTDIRKGRSIQSFLFNINMRYH